MGVVEDYLAGVADDDERECLAGVVAVVREMFPGASEKISYGMPTFVVDGKAIGGFLRQTNHLAWYPHSGTTLTTMADRLGSRKRTKSALHFTVADPLPDDLVRDLLATRRAEFA